MHQCLNCSKPCSETTIFCDECRDSLLNRLQPSGTEQAKRIIRPAKVRKGLPFFIILGAISLVLGGVLLAVNILQHYPSSLTDMAAITGPRRVLSPTVFSTTWQGKTQTPAISPAAGTPTSTDGTPGMSTGIGTQTSITSTTTPARGTTTPTPTSIPATPTTPTTCVLQVVPTHLSFTATLIQPDPPGQSITLKTTGACGKPVTWTATADASWIQLSSSAGSDSASGSTLTVYASSNQIVGVYNAHIIFSAMDSNGITLENSPQTISITLKVIG